MKSAHPPKQPLDSRQLRAFVTLANTGSFTRTGEELFLSQSAISHSMKALESDIGCRLFDRVGKKAQLTPAGEHFLHHAEKILREMSAARESIESRSKWGLGSLRVGASLTLCQYLLPLVLPSLRTDFPQTPLTIEACDTEGAFDLLNRGRIDMAMVLEPTRRHDFDFEPLFTDELVFVLSPKHPWVAMPQVPREEIPDQHFVLYSRTSWTYRLIEGYFRWEQIEMNSILELASMDAIKEFVKLGLGVGILAPWIVRNEVNDGSLVIRPLGKRKLKRRWGILFSKSHSRTLIEETFLRLARTATEKLGADLKLAAS